MTTELKYLCVVCCEGINDDEPAVFAVTAKPCDISAELEGKLGAEWAGDVAHVRCVPKTMVSER